MKILRLHIENFGKLSDRTIEFGDGLNIISGENESGKSTLHSFIGAMLLGLPRGRGRAAKDDVFSRYRPWGGGAYGGSITIEQGGHVYTLTRDLGPDEPSVFLRDETEGRDIPATAENISRATMGLTPSLLKNTISVGQLSAGTGRELADELRSHVVNLGSSGDYSLDVTAALKDLASQKKRIFGAFSKDAEAEAVQLSAKAEETSRRLEELREGEEPADLRKKRDEIEKEIGYIEENIENRRQDLSEQRLRHPFYVRRGSLLLPAVLIALFAAACVFCAWRLAVLIMAHAKTLPLVCFGAGALLSLIGLILSIRALCRAVSQRRRRRAMNASIRELEELLAEKKVRFASAASDAGAQDRALWERERLETELESLLAQRSALDPVLENNRNIRAEGEAIDLAVSTMKGISENEFAGFGGFLERSASKLIRGITGTYSGLLIGEDMELYLLRGGKRVSVRSVSAGTLDQVYLALRLACIRFFWQDEELPLLLDDTFAMYDDARLERTLCWLTEAAPGQALIFSCHTREERILEALGLEFKKNSLG